MSKSELEIMQNHNNWPPGIDILPLKNLKVKPWGIGILLPTGEPKVFLVNICNLPFSIEVFGLPTKETPVEEYNTFQEIIDSGWQID